LNLSTRFRNLVGATALALLVIFSGIAGTTPATYAAGSIVVGGKAVVANTDGANIRVREGAGTKYDQSAEAHEGEVVTVLDGPAKDANGNIWFKIQAPGGKGWILSDFLSSKSSSSQAAKPAAPALSGSARISNTGGDNIRVRGGAGTNHDQVAEAHEGEVVAILDGPAKDAKGNVWYKVRTPGGTGWVLADFLKSAGGAAPAAPAAPAPVEKPVSQAPKLTGFAKVTNTDGDYLRIRSTPSRNGSVLTTVQPDVVVAIKKGPQVDDSNTVWYQVTVEGTTGWAMAQYLVQAKAPAQDVKTQPKVVAPVVNLQPVIEAKPAAPAVKPQPAAPAAPANDVRTGTSRSAQQPVAIKSSSLGPSIVSTAMKYLGSRYVYGGTTPRGFDCSGFVYYVVNRSGKGISRDMGSQLASGTRISSKDLQPGDLLFFSNTYKRGLSHAGIYIGNGKFIHAENERTGVTISALWSSYWAAHYTAAVRLR
jgi:cell wall-associated NlpC family hydrolase